MAAARIPIPTAKDAPGVLDMMAALDKGITDKGADSQISGSLAAEIKKAAAKVAEGKAAHAEAKRLEEQLEKFYEKRNGIVNECLPLLRRGSKALQGNLGNARLHEMADYGYTVNASVKTPKPPKG